MKLLIDADIYAFRAVAATEEETDWGDDIWSLSTDLKIAKRIVQESFDQFYETLGSEDILLCFSSKDNFRKRINPTYKSGRKKTRKPLGYVALCDWLKHNYPHFSKPGLEADDCLGIMATTPENVGKAIIVSDDKDLKTIPGKLYRPTADERLDISEAEADKHFYMQTLTGDSTDGYPGCPTIGQKRAEGLLGQRPAWSVVEQAFIKQGLTKADALLQARMARILRWSDWDTTRNEPKLWEPAA
ncbi:hypothetical protein N9Y31_03420 [Alphaproteobacteria bacterium]|nr:hypothetical protein [Alphaproteobacteria bacterium]